MPVEPDPLAARTLRQRIGGRWAIAWQSYLVTAGLGLFALIAGEAASIRSLGDLGLWMGAWFAGALGIGLLLVVGQFTIFRNRRSSPVPVGVVIAFDGLCGVVFGLMVSVAAAALDLPTAQSPLQRIVLDTLYAMWWGPTLTYFLDYREQLALARRELISESVALELARMQQGEIVDRIQAELREEIGAELGPARDHVEALLSGAPTRDTSITTGEPADWQAVSVMLRSAADGAVRPLSRRLWSQGVERYPKVPWWTLVANIARYQPFRPVAYALVDIFGTLPALISVFGTTRALVLLGSGLAVTLPVGIGANALMRRLPRWHVEIFVAMIALMQVSVVARGALRDVWMPGSASPQWVITQVLAGIIVVLITSGFGAWNDKATELRANLRADLQHDHVAAVARSQQVATLAREAAQVLHGSVQTRLMACALAIEQAAWRDDNEALALALTEALNALDAPLPGAQEHSVVSTIADEVTRKVNLWEGFCRFDVTISADASTGNQSMATAVGRVVEEAISNAIRHGHATSISIVVEVVADGALHVVAIDNGQGPQGGSAGIGSAFLTQASAGQWSLHAVEGGARLEATLPQPADTALSHTR